MRTRDEHATSNECDVAFEQYRMYPFKVSLFVNEACLMLFVCPILLFILKPYYDLM